MAVSQLLPRKPPSPYGRPTPARLPQPTQPSTGAGSLIQGFGGMPNAPTNYAGEGVYRQTGQAPEGYGWDPTRGTYVPIQQTPAYQLKEKAKADWLAEQERARLHWEGQQDRTTQQINQQQAQTALQSFAGGGGPRIDSSSSTYGGSSAGGSAAVYGGSSAPAPDPQAAQRAAFSAAKSRAGSLARSSLESLRGELAERGILGGGTEARGIADTIFQGTGPLSDLNVAQQGEELDIAKRERELGEQRTATQYQGGITMRGQDIEAQQANEARRLQAALAGLRSLY